MQVNRRFIVMAVAMAAVLSSAAGPAIAATYAVTRLGDGPTAATTKGTLRWAITQAEANAGPDTILFKTQGAISLSSPLPPITTEITINGPGITLSGKDLYQIFLVGPNSDSTSFGNLTLSRLTLANGAAEFAGGAIYIVSGTVTAANCVFRGNSAALGGGAICSLGESNSVPASLALTGCTFRNNSVGEIGGAILVLDGDLSATDCTFNQNSCVAPEGYDDLVAGGAVADFTAPSGDPFATPPALVHCTFTGNTASSEWGDAYGGAVAGLWVSATRCTFSNNVAISTAPTALSEGGAILAIYGALVTDCAFARNRAGDPAADPGTFPSAGGAIATPGGYNIDNGGYMVAAVNCSFGANSASDGSAVSTDVLYMANSIVWGNPAGDGLQLSAYGGEVSFSDVQLPEGEVFFGEGNINANPRWLLNPQQGDQDGNGGVLQLLEGSPCIDAGNNEIAQQLGLTVDLLGRNRFINDPDTPDTGVGAPPIVDMGAYEFRP